MNVQDQFAYVAERFVKSSLLFDSEPEPGLSQRTRKYFLALYGLSFA